ncbi:MAG: hypothetical protein AAB677_01085 [Patescibacteria group bacterium]
MKQRISLIIVWLLNLAVIGMIVWLAIVLRADAETTIKTHRESYLLARARADTLNWREVLKTSAPDRARVAKIFVNRDSLIDFIEEIETITHENLVVFKLGEPVITSDQLKLTLPVQGAFPDIYRLIERFENLPYQLAIEQIDLNSGVDWQGQITFNLLSFNDQHVQD